MGDKLKKGLAVQTTFVDGETPSAAKLSTISSQAAYALQQIEKAVGDAHDESYPYATGKTSRLSDGTRKVLDSALVSAGADRPLDIASVARLIGPASDLNPHELESGTVIENIPAGVHEFATRYPIDGAVTSVVITTGGAAFTAQRTSLSAMTAAGDFYITQEGKVYTTTATSGGTIEYAVDPTTWGGGTAPQLSRFNVIPDPNQLAAGGSGCAIGAIDPQGRYPVTLPAITHQQWSETQTTAVLQDQDINKDVTAKLPIVITDNYSPGDLLPDGFVILKNYTTGEVYDDGEYYYNGESAILVGNVDLDAAVTAGDKFQVITVGTSITSSIDDLRRKSAHSHDRTWGEPFAVVDGLSGVLTYAGAGGAYIPSENANNFAPQYLHRDGYQPGVDANYNDANAMRGDIVFSAVGGSPGAYLLSSGESFAVYFGSHGTNEWRIKRDTDAHLYIGGVSAGKYIKLKNTGIMSDVIDDSVSGLVGIKPVARSANLASTITESLVTISNFTHASNSLYGLSILVNVISFSGGAPSFDPTTTDAWLGPNDNSEWGYWAMIEENGTDWLLRIVWTGSRWGGSTTATARYTIWHV